MTRQQAPRIAPDVAGAISAQTRFAAIEGPWRLEFGDALTDVTVAYRTWGTLNAERSNAILVCHALTGSADADAWWPGLIGAGAALDPAHDFIICSNVLGGCYGSTGPYTRRADGSRWGGDFPRISVRDMVAVQRALLEQLGIARLKLVIGPSLGGMQVLEWACSYPESVAAIAPIGVSARHSAWCIGVGHAQRAAIVADPHWAGGRYDDARPPRAGLAAARMMAMISYRSWNNFELRFGRDPDQHKDFSVASYLDYQGEKLNDRFDAASYVRLTEAMDSHDVGRGRDGGTAAVLARTRCPALVVSVASDVLYPPLEQEYLARHLPEARYRSLNSEHGHDGFLIELEALSDIVREFRSEVAAAH